MDRTTTTSSFVTHADDCLHYIHLPTSFSMVGGLNCGNNPANKEVVGSIFGDTTSFSRGLKLWK